MATPLAKNDFQNKIVDEKLYKGLHHLEILKTGYNHIVLGSGHRFSQQAPSYSHTGRVTF